MQMGGIGAFDFRRIAYGADCIASFDLVSGGDGDAAVQITVAADDAVAVIDGDTYPKQAVLLNGFDRSCRNAHHVIANLCGKIRTVVGLPGTSGCGFDQFPIAEGIETSPSTGITGLFTGAAGAD